MTSVLQSQNVLFTARYLIGMAHDPLRRMRRMGLQSPSATVMPMGPGQRAHRLLYLTGGENAGPVFADPATFNSSNIPLRSGGGGAQSRLRRGLIGARGAEHQHYRHAFIMQTARGMMEEFSAGVASHVDAWTRGLPEDEPVDLVTMINDLVRYYSVVMMFKDENPEQALRIGREITEWVELGYQASNVLLPFNVPGLPHARYKRSAEALEARILEWADARRGMDAKRDILSMFVNGPDENGEPLSRDRLTGHILTIYAASFTSSVSSLIWALFLLMQHPGIAHDLCDEIDGSGIDPVSEGMKFLELPLLDRVLKESMRLFTPVPYQVRRVTRDATVAGAGLKAKDIVVVGAWATNRLASVYSGAEKFRPDRWIETDSNTLDYLTFSAGPRRCVGYQLAMIMVKITLASILSKRRPNLLPDARIDTKVAVTLRSKQPILVMMGNRDTKIMRSPVRGTVTNHYDP